MGTVRDGSKKELCNGYWMMDILACDAGGHNITPLYQYYRFRKVR